MNAPARPLKAYSVQEEDENIGGIVFAKSNVEARRRGSSMFGDGDFNWGRATRAPGFDRYAPGPVPFVAMFESGWWQECHGCGCRIAQDEYDDEGGEIEFDIVEVGSAVYCRPSCRDNRLAERAEIARIEKIVIDELIERLLRAMPGAVVSGPSHVYVPFGGWPHRVEQASIGFTFPGARIGFGTFRFDKLGEKPYVTICGGDRVAFYAWQEAGYPPHLMDAKEVA